MKPEKLTICGWGPYRDLVQIDFHTFDGRGLFLITGATGAGKTTIFDAITYALYGSLSGEVRDKERSSVRSDFAQPDTPTYVELEMSHGGKRYRIRRNPEYLRPRKRGNGSAAFTREKENALLRVEGEDLTVEGVKEVNAYLKEILALDYPQFKQLSMIAQGEFARLLTAPPKDKTKIFREIFGTGIYERFTANLGQKARQKYLVILEQRAKQQELVLLLADSIAGSEVSREEKERFLTLTEAKNWNYEALENYLEESRGVAKKCWKIAEKELAGIEVLLREKTELLTRKQEENKRILEYLKAAAVRAQLSEQKEEITRKEQKYRQAVNAGWVESGEVRLQSVERRLEVSRKEAEALKETLGSLETQLAERMPVWELRESLERLLQNRKAREEEEETQTLLNRKLQDRQQEEIQKKERFLAEEKKSIACKQAYEEAVRSQRRAAIGIAAGMLVPGEPCPVCGSTEHPAPAPKQKGILTEEELDRLKEKWNRSEEITARCYKDVVVLQTLINDLQEKIRQSAEHLETLQVVIDNALAEDKTGLFMTFCCQKYKDAAEKLRKNVEEVQNMQVILQEKRKRMHQLEELLQELTAERECAAEAFEALLVQYGFPHRAAYEQAALDKQTRETLARVVEEYHRNVNANEKLMEHLEGSIVSREPLELQSLEEEILGLQTEKEAALRKARRWEQLLRELERTHREFCAKRQHLEALEREYGLVKELENIATGNNAKKLVFEQYVLAGYFEEILKAANIRFRKMTSGRYEMHRAQEVGDGRVKDNLEIQVMDYYTGRHRSVRTLSGGESFKASLSLALGLSDVIQAMSGGIRVEALFIDEGFGALDSESLDQACETLLSLVESDRLIGIISHVPELRERIQKQIIIEKSGNGSVLRVAK